MNLKWGTLTSNRTLLWTGNDSYAKWKWHNFRASSRNRLKELGYKANSITYVYNEHGFRTEHLHDKGNSIVFVGCSFTEGIGVRFVDTYPYILSKKLNLDCINLGVGGASNDSSFRIASYWVPKLKPSIVVFQPTQFCRMETYTRNVKLFNLDPDTKHEYWPAFCRGKGVGTDVQWFIDYYQHYVQFDENLKLNYDKNRLAIEQICQNNRIKFIQTYDGDLKDWSKPDVGRDLAHPGVKSHQHMADIILKKINEER